MHEKGVDLLLRAGAVLTPCWKLLLAGEGEERSVLEKLAEDLGISQKVTFLGRRSSGDE